MEIGWIQEVEFPTSHREPPCDASVCIAVARGCLVAISLDNQSHNHWGNPRLHVFRARLICVLHPRSNIILQLPLLETLSTTARTVVEYITRGGTAFARSLQSHHAVPFHRKPREISQGSSSRCCCSLTRPDLRGDSNRLGGLQE